MQVIDSDSHVIETERTWDYFDEADKELRPKRLTDEKGEDFLLIDGRLYPNRRSPDVSRPNLGDRIPTPAESRFMDNVPARIRHMDELGTDVQVLYPTLMNRPYTDRPRLEAAMCRSYNRWMGEIWAESKGRLRWAVVLPFRTPDRALEEMRWAKDHGACAIFSRCVECNKPPGDRYFFQVYAQAQDLDMPICIHSGNGSFEQVEYHSGSSFAMFKLAGLAAFHNVVFNNVPEEFPKLRFGFIELSANWVPYVNSDLVRRMERLEKPFKENVLVGNRVYVACQTNDDLPYVLDAVGDDNLVIGTDYGHADSSSELYALQTFRASTEIPPTSITKILDDNARALYSI